jgi:hypothetical protein
MFPADPHSMNQLHAADMHVAHERRTRGKVVSSPERRWHRALLAKLAIRREQAPSRPVITAYERAQRRRIHSTTSFTLVGASTGPQLDD